MSQFVGKVHHHPTHSRSPPTKHPSNTSQTRLAYSRAWHLVDASADPRPLGRLASSIALTLMGKHKPIYDPSTDCGDYVVCTGLSQLQTTGKKMQKKKYYSHTTRPGSLKEITMERMMEKWGGGEILRRAVRGMLPKNRLRDDRMARLKCRFLSFRGEWCGGGIDSFWYFGG
jgi:large subunit ribosomal protein L13